MMTVCQRVFHCTSIGSIAFEALANDQSAKIVGTTSRGLFIQTSGKWLVFLTPEQFRGPLSLTLEGSAPFLDRLSSRDPVRISSRSIYLPYLNITISTAGSHVWQPPQASELPLGAPERYEKLFFFARDIQSKKKGVGLASLISPLMGMPDAQTPHPIHNYFDSVNLDRIRDYLHNKDVASLIEQLSALLGAGPGLTPSFDDLVAGLLLALNRWHIPHWASESLSELNQQVVKAAYEKTTTLSANLIECATQGLANERLINALDWIVTGVVREPEVVAHLLEWGNSSGVDAFTGMAIVLTA
jgi:Protein of unknown function (DUF2877)